MRERFLIDSRPRISRTALVLLLAVAGCHGPECVVSTTQYTTSVSASGIVGPTQGLPVARFDLTQDFVTHTPYEACVEGPLQDVGVVSLKVTSTASATLAIEFDVQGLNADGTPVWFQRETIQRIAPGQTVDVGEVSTSPTHVDKGARVILTSVTVVP
jgi:hypothetical protein